MPQLFNVTTTLLSSLRMVPTGGGAGGRGEGAHGGLGGLGRLLAAGARLLEENRPDRFICCNEKKMSRTSNNGFWTMKEDFGFCGRNEWGL